MDSESDSSGTDERCDAFISYSHSDKEWTHKLVEKLRQVQIGDRNLKICIDEDDFVPGKSLLKSIEDGIKNSDKLICILSPNYVTSDYTDLEVQMKALDDPAGRRGLIIPIIHKRSEIPPFFRIRYYIDFSDENHFDISYNRLLYALGALPQNNEGQIPQITSTARFSNNHVTSSVEPDSINEELNSNAFPVEKMPEFVYHIQTSARTRRELAEISDHKFRCGIALRSGELWTFCDLNMVEGSLLKRIGTGYIEKTPTNHYYKAEMLDLLIELLNSSLQWHLRQENLDYDRSHKRFLFRPGILDGGNRQVSWPGIAKTGSRTVVKSYVASGARKYFIHHAAKIHFAVVGGRFCLIINPERVRTLDGRKTIRKSGGFNEVSRIYNSGFWLDIMFWLYQLHSNKGFRIGRRDFELTVSPKPLAVATTFGIYGDKKDMFSLNFLSRWEDYEIELEETNDSGEEYD